MIASKRKDHADYSQVALDNSSVETNYTKKPTPFKPSFCGFMVQIIELERVSDDTSQILVNALNDMGISEINYMPFDGYVRAS